MVTNEERIASYQERKAQGATATDLLDLCQLVRPGTIAEAKKDRDAHGYRSMSLEEARSAMRADLATGVPVNGWPV